jgi:predicted neutral ceramidase superfamily lipid hydrolase
VQEFSKWGYPVIETVYTDQILCVLKEGNKSFCGRDISKENKYLYMSEAMRDLTCVDCYNAYNEAKASDYTVINPIFIEGNPGG